MINCLIFLCIKYCHWIVNITNRVCLCIWKFYIHKVTSGLIHVIANKWPPVHQSPSVSLNTRGSRARGFVFPHSFAEISIGFLWGAKIIQIARTHHNNRKRLQESFALCLSLTRCCVAEAQSTRWQSHLLACVRVCSVCLLCEVYRCFEVCFKLHPSLCTANGNVMLLPMSAASGVGRPMKVSSVHVAFSSLSSHPGSLSHLIFVTWRVSSLV